jgi:hypothetical protein
MSSTNSQALFKTVASKERAPVPISRSSSMQANAGDTELQIVGEAFKPTAKGTSNMCYSMDRWFNQKPNEEPWCGFSR